MVQSIARWAYLVLSVLFLLGVAVQTFFAGLGMFGDPGGFALHVNLGWILHLAPLLLLLTAALGRAGRRSVWLTFALAVVVFVQPLLPAFREAMPAAAALHPVNALVIFWLTIVVVRRAWPLATRGAQVAPEVEPAPSAT